MEIQIKDINLYYEDIGKGEVILFLHGWGASIKSWGIIPTNLSSDFRCISVDFPGFGNTKEANHEMTVYDYADIIIEFIEKLQLDNINIVCHSFGGRVSIILANKIPNKIKKMLFTDAAGVKPRRTFKYHLKVKTYKICKKIYNIKFLAKFAKAIGIDIEKKVKNAGSSDYQQLSNTMKKTFINVVNCDLTPILRNISCPTLLVWGELDTDTPLYMAKIMEKEIRDCGLVVFYGANHFSYLSDIPRYTSIIKVFFGGK